MHSIRFKFFVFVLAILLILLLLLNTYPIISSRDAVFQEKRSAMSAQGAVVSSALGGLEKLSRDGVTDVFRFLDLGNYDRIVVTDESGNIIYDDRGGAVETKDLGAALAGKSVFRSDALHTQKAVGHRQDHACIGGGPFSARTGA